MAYCARFACGSAGGEVDVRGAYTALATAHMLKLDKVALAKQAGVVQYVCKCQVEHLNGCCPLCRNSTHLHHLSTKCNTLVISPPDALHLLCHACWCLILLSHIAECEGSVYLLSVSVGGVPVDQDRGLYDNCHRWHQNKCHDKICQSQVL